MTGIICATETEMKAIINEIKNIRENNVGKIIRTLFLSNQV